MALVHFPQQSLYKFCPDEYDISKGCNTIRIGTLYEYRTHENELLRDSGEGRYLYRFSFPKLTKVSNEWIAAIQMDQVGTIETEHIELTPQGTYIKGFTMDGSSHNCWIYCVSRNSESAGDISKAHQSKWEIPFEKVQAFGTYLCNLLWNEINYSDLPPQLLKQFSIAELQQGLNLHLEIRSVNYESREIVIQREEDLPIERIAELRQSIPFTKPEKFKPENEIRFAFHLKFHDRIIPIQNNAKIINLRSVDKIIKQDNGYF